jgi:hypothetical protein
MYVSGKQMYRQYTDADLSNGECKRSVYSLSIRRIQTSARRRRKTVDYVRTIVAQEQGGTMSLTLRTHQKYSEYHHFSQLFRHFAIAYFIFF